MYLPRKLLLGFIPFLFISHFYSKYFISCVMFESNFEDPGICQSTFGLPNTKFRMLLNFSYYDGKYFYKFSLGDAQKLLEILENSPGTVLLLKINHNVGYFLTLMLILDVIPLLALKILQDIYSKLAVLLIFTWMFENFSNFYLMERFHISDILDGISAWIKRK
jgi:hypothetical protein